ncbi:MAG: hypothetical protein EXR58_04500 [Chloroflexi bacterium]|nr:hypothetical protein [Chloroflexota bacterium]
MLLGTIHGSLFHLAFGRRMRHLPAATAIGIGGSLLGGLIGTLIPPAVLAIGDTNLIATAIGAWAGLGIARLYRLC